MEDWGGRCWGFLLWIWAVCCCIDRGFPLPVLLVARPNTRCISRYGSANFIWLCFVKEESKHVPRCCQSSPYPSTLAFLSSKKGGTNQYFYYTFLLNQSLHAAQWHGCSLCVDLEKAARITRDIYHISWCRPSSTTLFSTNFANDQSSSRQSARNPRVGSFCSLQS